MIYKMTLKDSTDEMTFNLLEVPIVDKDIEGAVDNVTLDGNQYTDYLYLKKQYIQKWSIMCDEEYERLRGFYTRQFDEAEIPTYELYYGETIYNGYTRSGDYILVDVQGVEPARMSLAQIDGNATQTTYSGKNLYIGSPSFDGYTQANGWVEDGTHDGLPVYKRSGAWSGAYKEINVEAGNYYTFSVWIKSDEERLVGIYHQGGTATTSSLAKTFTTTTSWAKYSNTIYCTGSGTMRFRVENSTSIADSYTYVAGYQLELGSTATSYKPYVGGTPAPNPQFPQPISVVTGENVVKVVGKNLWGGLTAFSTSAGGVNFTNNADGSVTASGTATSNTSSIPSPAVAINNNWFVTLPSGNYTASAGTLPSGVLLQIYNANTGASLGNAQGQFTLTEQTQVYARIRVASGTTIDATFNVQLELGNQATSYQAYTEQDYAISLTGKNLFNKATSTDGYRIDSNGDPYANASYFISDYIKVQPSTTYAYSRGAAGSSMSTIAYYKSDKTFISRTMPTIGSSDTSGTVTTPNNAYYARFCDVNEVLDSAQLELGSTATEYEAYSPIELAKIGTYRDRIYKDGDKWYVEKNTFSKIFDGSESWGIQGTRTHTFYSSLPTTSMTGICDHFTGISSSGFDVTEGCYLANSNRFIVSFPSMNSADDLKTWLTANPTKIVCGVASASALHTITEITNQALINQLEALVNISITTGIHNIFTEVASGNLNPVMILNFIEVVSRRVTLVPETPVRLALTDGGIINACGCRKDVQLTMRETIE